MVEKGETHALCNLPFLYVPDIVIILYAIWLAVGTTIYWRLTVMSDGPKIIIRL